MQMDMTVELMLAALIAVFAVTALNRTVFLAKNTDWENAFGRSKMRRRRNGKWEYRDATQDEIHDRDEGEAW